MKCFIALTQKTNCEQIIQGMVASVYDNKNAEITEPSKQWIMNISSGKTTGKAVFISTADRHTPIKLFRESNGNQLGITGYPIIQNRPLDPFLNSIISLSSKDAAKALTYLDGAFNAFFYTPNENKLILINDFLGMQPLFIHRSAGLLLIASEQKALIGSGCVPLEMDEAGWGSFIAFGHTIGNLTMTQKISKVPPGSYIDIDINTLQEKSQTYWSWPKGNPKLSLENINQEFMINSLRKDIIAYKDYIPDAVMLMSGGFDSRIVFALTQQEQCCSRAIVLSHSNELWGADGKFGKECCREYGSVVEEHKPNSGYYSTNKYLEYLEYNEITTTSLYLFISQVFEFLSPDFKAVWEGMAPGLIFRPPHQPPGGFPEYLAKETFSENSREWKSAKFLFGRSKSACIYDAFRHALDQEIQQYSQDAFGVSEFIVRNRMRNRTGPNPLQIYSNIVIPFTPGLNKELWNYCSTIPFDAYKDNQLYLNIFKTHFPKIKKIPIVSGSDIFPKNSLWGRLAFIRNKWKKHEFGRLISFAYNFARYGRPIYWEDSKWMKEIILNTQNIPENIEKSQFNEIKNSINNPLKRASIPGRQLLFYYLMWQKIIGKR